MRYSIATAAALLLIAATSVAAQAPPARAVRPAEPALKLDREVYEYAARGRRDPFRPLTSDDVAGPLFTELVLVGIFYTQDPSRSYATVRDGAKKHYRLGRGDNVGNATVLNIDKTQVVFSIEEFGMKRQEVLELTLKREGAAQ